ncbi:hypothetical protein N9J22_00135 [bacterium]|nr:hypothetical protein [Gammaproteobacteria bacterium]MDA8899674.1 hypothetical protein [Gammaproteobacteria bacterium]MDA9002892.1 hypothetical protein [bacterium]MDC3325794.1 hypothetical protein [Gammaproteobacteria bacterium]|tara:strand:- start:2289 stop:3311 length:1023 start_codon:yes stop_codon:yes gene_type:complete
MEAFKSIIIIFSLLCSANLFSINVSIVENKLFLDGEPLYMKGICYHPVPKGSTKRNFLTLEEDLVLMKEAGINTIRVYEPIDDINVLNAINDANMKVVISFGYNQNGIYDIISGTYIEYVKKYLDHDAIIMWELGNEYNYNPQWFEGDIDNWYRAMNQASIKIQTIDKNRLVSSAHGDIPDSNALQLGSSINIWGVNIYRWDEPASVFDDWKAVSDKPIYFSEIGSDSYMTKSTNVYKIGINEKAQSDANTIILNEIIDNVAFNEGAFIFQFADGLWKAGNPSIQDTGGSAPNSDGTPYDGTANEEYWGIVDIDRRKKDTFYAIKNIYSEFRLEESSSKQ